MDNNTVNELEIIYDRAIRKGDEELADLICVLINTIQQDLTNTPTTNG